MQCNPAILRSFQLVSWPRRAGSAAGGLQCALRCGFTVQLSAIYVCTQWRGEEHGIWHAGRPAGGQVRVGGQGGGCARGQARVSGQPGGHSARHQHHQPTCCLHFAPSLLLLFRVHAAPSAPSGISWLLLSCSNSGQELLLVVSGCTAHVRTACSNRRKCDCREQVRR